MITNKVRSAGLADILGSTDNQNVQGEVQQKLDVMANEIIIKAMDHGGRLCAMASEEEAEAWEGCLSFPELLVKVSRPLAVRVEYLNDRGDPCVMDLIDFPARVVQHVQAYQSGQQIPVLHAEPVASVVARSVIEIR